MTFYCFFVVDTDSIGCSQKKRAFPEFDGGWVDIDLAVSSPQVACSQNKRLHKSPFSNYFVHKLQIFQLAAAYSLIYIYRLFCYILFIKTMRINPNPRLSFIFLIIIILAISQLSSCRHLHIKIGDQNKQRAEADVFTQLSWHFPAKASEGSSKDEIDDPVYGVSYRAVPGGPNPLHNWL